MRTLSSRPSKVATASIVLLAACTAVLPAGMLAQSPGATLTGTLRYLVESPESPEALQPLEAHIDEFEAAHPGLTVELQSIPLESMRTVLQTQLRSENGPDVFAWGSGPAYAGSLAEAGLLYDLTEAYEANDWPIYEFAKKQVTVDGRLVGVPGELETIGIFINRTLFGELGIAQPTNLAELQAAAQTLKDNGYYAFAMADKEGWEGSHWLSMALSSRVGSAGMESLLTGETPWGSPDVVAALKVWDDWNKAGYFPPTPTAIDYDSGNALFFAGEAGMIPTGSWLITEIEANSDFEIAYIPFPSESGPGIFTGGLGSGPYVSANTQNPDAAIAFVDFLVSPEHGRWVVENLDAIPAFPVDTTGLDVSPVFAQVLADTAQFAGGAADFGTNIDVLSTEVFNQAMFDGIQAMLTGQKTPEQVAADLETAYQQG